MADGEAGRAQVGGEGADLIGCEAVEEEMGDDEVGWPGPLADNLNGIARSGCWGRGEGGEESRRGRCGRGRMGAGAAGECG